MHDNKRGFPFRTSYRWYYQIGYNRRQALLNAFLDTRIGIRFFG